MDKLVNLIDDELKRIEEEGLDNNNLLELDKLVDIKKDICEIEEKEEEKKMAYYRGNYGENYGRGGSYGREGNYGRRGYDAKYRGDRYLGDMQEEYGHYMGDRERYGADSNTMKSLEYMLKSAVEFVKMLKQDAQTQEEVDLIQEYTREMSNV